MRIAPLRSGAPGGAWAADQISFRDGRPLEPIPGLNGTPSLSPPKNQYRAILCGLFDRPLGR
jgi:hypothetical protein